MTPSRRSKPTDADLQSFLALATEDFVADRTERSWIEHHFTGDERKQRLRTLGSPPKPPQAAAAEHFGMHASTISRRIKRMKRDGHSDADLGLTAKADLRAERRRRKAASPRRMFADKAPFAEWLNTIRNDAHLEIVDIRATLRKEPCDPGGYALPQAEAAKHRADLKGRLDHFEQRDSQATEVLRCLDGLSLHEVKVLIESARNGGLHETFRRFQTLRDGAKE